MKNKLAYTVVLIFGVAPLLASVVKIQLPTETGVFKPAPGIGAGLANAQCLICHSVDYVQMQPPLPQKFWTAEVKKMRDKYGAPFPEGDSAILADYLARNYGTETNNAAAVSPAANALAAADSQPMTAEALATRFGCLSCHKVNVKVVGPAFADVAQKYRQDPAALDKISAQIHHGGSGKWGSAVMPPYNTLLTDTQVETLGRWILSQGAAK